MDDCGNTFQLPHVLLVASPGAMGCYLAHIVGCSAFHVVDSRIFHAVARPVGSIHNE